MWVQGDKKGGSKREIGDMRTGDEHTKEGKRAVWLGKLGGNVCAHRSGVRQERGGFLEIGEFNVHMVS